MESRYIPASIRAALSGIGAGLAVLVAGALIALRLSDPGGFLTVAGYGALVLGAVMCGILQGRSGAPLSAALLAAALYCLLPMTLSLILGGTHGFWLRAAVYLGMAAIALLTAWLIPSAKPRRRYRY